MTKFFSIKTKILQSLVLMIVYCSVGFGQTKRIINTPPLYKNNSQAGISFNVGAGGSDIIIKDFGAITNGAGAYGIYYKDKPINTSTAGWFIKDSDYGNGSDGILNATSGTVYTDNVRTAVTGTNSAGSSTLVTSSSTGFSVGDEVLIITMVDKATSNNTVGQHEFNTISSISGNTITLASNKTHAYTASSSQKHQVLKVPNYTSVTVASGVTLTCHSWDGSSGGILAFRANGSVTNSGTITVSEKGYRGIGHASSLSGNAHWRNKDGAQGEGIYGTGYAGGNSSGANNATWNGANGNGGGGGTGRQDSGGGGGGGYAANGTKGTNSGGHFGGTGGIAVGITNLSKLIMGGAGGEGGGDEDGHLPGAGGNGGGIIMISCANLTNNGSITANGANGGNGTNTNPKGGNGRGCGMAGGGGGAGGSVKIVSSFNSASGTIASLAGNGGATNGCGGAGAKGSVGRIALASTVSSYPTTTPTSSNESLSANSWIKLGTFASTGNNSAPISLTNKGLNLIIPANKTYGFAIFSKTGSSMNYMTYNSSLPKSWHNNNECKITVGPNVGFGIENSGKANYYPRSFVGFVDYELSNKAPKISFIKNDTICSGSIGDSLLFSIKDVDVGDLELMKLTAIASDTNILPSAAFTFYNNSSKDTIRALRVSLPDTSLTARIPVFIIATDKGQLSDTTVIFIQIDSLPSVNLGPDTAFCKNAAYTIRAGANKGNYIWNNSSSSSSDTLEVNSKGIYYVSITDANACSNIDTIDIDTFEVPQFRDTTLNVLCKGDRTGSLYLDGIGGKSGYSFDWLVSSSNLSGMGNRVAQTLAAGSYKVTITDANNCKNRTVFTITEPSTSVDVHIRTKRDVFCKSDSTGLVSVVALGGVSPYVYSWNDNKIQIDSHAVNLGAGTYQVVVTDSNNCSDSISQLITEPAVQLSLSILNKVQPLCTLDTIGSVKVTSNGGTGTHTYLWNDNLSQTDTLITKLIPGNYGVTVTDALGCVDSISVSLPALDTLRSIFTFPDSVICNKDTSRLLLGLPANDGVFSGNGVSNNALNPKSLSVGTHVITYTRTERSCIADTTDTIRINPNPIASIGNLGSICTNTPDLLLNVGSPSNGYFFGNNVSVTDSATYNPSNTALNDTINYVFTNGFGCSDSAFKVIAVDTIPLVTAAAVPNVCLDASEFVLTNGSPKLNGVGVYIDTANNSVVANKYFPSVTGNDTANIQYKFTETLTGCSDSVMFTIIVDSLPILRPNLLGDICVNDTSFSLDSVWIPNQPNYIGSGVSTVDSLTFNPAVAGVGTHQIAYSFTDLNSCKADTQFSIVVRPTPAIVFNALQDVCADADTFTLTAATPFGGKYYGPGVINDTSFVADTSLDKQSNTLNYVVDNQYGCIDTAAGSIYVDTLPVVSFNPSLGNICFNEEFKKINFGIPKATVAGEVGVYSGNGVRNDSIITAISGTGLFNITYEFTDTNGCSSSIADTIRVDTVPTVTLAAFNPVCEDVDTVHLNGGFPLGGVFTATSPNRIDTTLSGIYYLNTLDSGGTVDTIIYTYTNLNGCIGSAAQAFSIDSLPDVIFTLPSSDDTLCHGSSSIALSGVNLLGGIFSNVDGRVSNNNYLSDTNTTRNDTIAYTYTDANGCTNSDTDFIHIDSIPVITLGSSPVFCAADDSIQLTVGNGNGFYTGQRGIGADSLSFLPDSAKAGTHLVTYNLENVGCFSIKSFSIVVHPQPIVTLPQFTDICENLDTFYLTGGAPVGNSINSSYKGNGVQNGYFDPTAVGSGIATVWYLYENTFGCIDSASNTMNIKAAPNALFSGLDTTGYCENADTIHLENRVSPRAVSPYETVFKGKGIVSNTIFDPSIAGTGVHELWYVVNDTANGCSDSTSQFALVNSLPLVSLNAIGDICENGSSFKLSGGSQISFNGRDTSKYTVDSLAIAGDVFIPANYIAGNSYKVTYTFTDTAQCSDSASRVFNVLAKPIVQLFDSTLKFCTNENPYQLTEGFPKTGGTGVYRGSGVFSGTFFPQFASAGIDTMSYIFTASNSCIDTAIASYRVKTAPSIQVSSALKYCDKDGIDTLDFATNTVGNGYGIYSGAGVTNDSIFNVDSAGVGVHNIQVAYFDTSFGYTCADSSTHVLTVNTSPTVALQNAADLCLNSARILGFGLPQGGLYYEDTLLSSNQLAGNRFIANDTAGSQKIIYQYFDANGCWDSASTVINILPQPNVSFALGDSVACYSENLVRLTGGSPVGGSYLGKGIFQNQLYTQSSGTGYLDIVYQFTDSNNCNNSDTAKLLVAIDPVLNISNDTMLCAGSLVNLFAAGAGKGALYTWSTGVQNPNISVSPRNTTNYSVIGLDTNGCSDQKSVRVEVLPEIILTTSSQNAGCGKSDGIANVSVAGGLPPFKYLWTSGSKNAIATGLKAGFYEVTVTDANVCNNSASAVIKNTNGPNVVVNGITNASCAGVADGSIALDIQGAVLSIQWSNGAITEDINGLSPGKYILTVIAADSCITTQEFTITAPDAMQIDALVQAPKCGSNDGFVTLNVTGGVFPYRYDWSNSTSNDTLIAAGAGVYQVTVTDDNSCTDSIEVVVSDSGAPVISLIKVIQPDCGSNNGEIHIDINKDTLAQFRWNTGDSTYIIKNLVHGVYRATATDTAGCRGLTNITLNSITPRAKELCVATIDTATGLAQVVWSNTGAKEIEVFTKALGRKDFSVLGSAPVNVNVFTDSLPTLIDKSYSYAIKSTDSCGSVSELSGLHQTIYLTSQLDKDNNIILRWTAYAGFKYSEYEIMRVANGVMSEYGRAGIGTNEIIISGEEFGAANIYYIIRVAAPESCGPTDYYDYSWSNKSINYGSFNINVDHPGNLAICKLYPNPNGGQFTLQLGFNAETNVGLRITDMSGRVVWNANLDNVFGVVTLPIDLMNNAAGMYQLRIDAADEVFMERIQVIR